jgi:predicted SnoaL-like aldol condensation-catalyzing enzyme
MTAITSPIDNLAKDHWSEGERANAELVAEFVRLAMNDHDYEALRRRFGAGAYRQHSRGIPDGIDGLAGYLESLTRRYPEYQYEVRHVHVDGDHVVFHSHATLRAKHRGNDRKGLNIIDTWRVVDGQIVEHWDAIQPLDLSMRLFNLFAGGRAKHANPVF